MNEQPVSHQRGNGHQDGGEMRTVNPRRVKIVGALAVLLILLIVLARSSDWLVDWLWMKEVRYTEVFLRLFSLKVGLFFCSFIVVFLYLWINLRIAVGIYYHRGAPVRIAGVQNLYDIQTNPRITRILMVVVALVVAFFFGMAFFSGWDTFLRYWWGGSFGRVDPFFGKDLGFYVLRLPFYKNLRDGVTMLTFLALPATFLSYLVTGQIGLSLALFQSSRARVHLAVLFILFLFAWGSGYYLDIFQLFYEKRGAVFGMGYTSYHVVRVSLWVMMTATVLLALLAGVMRGRPGTILAGIGAYVVVMLLSLAVVPALFQSFIVQPNELSLERPFLEKNIAFTRQAYQLDRVEEKPFAGGNDLTVALLSRNQDTLNNIRLWDYRPLLQAFKQTQEMRLYYRFFAVDVDRYVFPGEGYRQVMVSPRELTDQALPQGSTWVNQYLEYTHGYGLAMNMVSEIAEGGLPKMVVKDLPPQSSLLKIDRPAIYYGENMVGYRIVRTGVEEFDYPKGDKNVYVRYEGAGGIALDSIWKRLLFAWYLYDGNILISSYIKPESRIQLYRKVTERAKRIAPFITLDGDPYMVVSQGKLIWIIDGYTTSTSYPSSEPFNQSFNYIRNSVKITVDAYDGSVRFFMSDSEDPIIRAYQSAFPGMFKPLGELSPDLKAHVRYPEGLFRVQAERLTAYHMTDPRVFYNKEDMWTMPNQKYGGKAEEMEPYYALIRLPGEQKLTFQLMLPMTPYKRENMVAWMAANCDFPDYGKLVVYRLSKDRLIYGPMQIEAMIDQTPAVSQQLTLWDQKGSHVIRGNLLVIPIENSFLYVEPVYLIAEDVNIPQLIRVIVAYGNKVAMQPTLDEAIKAVFGSLPAVPAAAASETKVPAATGLPKSTEDVLGRVRTMFNTAQEALKKGNWAEFGKAMDGLKGLLGR
jgi:uncharacterized protein